ncbi:MAG: cupin domain-containing protein [Ignavibacteriae bacterium]|jgi:quercetin dioxygenase-like cupin family protein|nr:cupin domain-containing protein [Ignavibacteriota bacterium]NOG98578.1 cupin domain-containing protein [Ignavibacteriota bacterium]
MAKSNRESLGERQLRAPMLSFSINEEIEKLLKEPGWLNGDRNAVTLQKNPKLRVVLISLRKGASLLEHKVEGPITVLVLSGNINFIIGDDKVNAKANGMIVLEKTIPHDVEALEDSTFILTIIQP